MEKDEKIKFQVVTIKKIAKIQVEYSVSIETKNENKNFIVSVCW